MALATGARLGTYEITGHLGSGGMGEVYRARDGKLGREVAIKVMPDELAHDAERLARFEREARVLAALNHSNVATLYGFETHDGAGFLVMELVEGETLADRIARGPVPVGEALPLFVQIAEGLEAAHAKGVIHRDLKPANIKAKEDGAPKILDFGLAKALAPEPAAGGDAALSASPTLTLQATRRGEILGTAAYMSPEQARGLESDPRADVWGFGCCLYEALTGQRPFSGEDAAQTLASVLKDEPDWDALPRTCPRTSRVLAAPVPREEPRGPGCRRSATRGSSWPRLWSRRRGSARGRNRRRGAARRLDPGRPRRSGSPRSSWASRRRDPPQPRRRFERYRRADASFDRGARRPRHQDGQRGEQPPALERRSRALRDRRPRIGSPDPRPPARRAVLPPGSGHRGLDDTGFTVSPDGEWVGFFRDRTLWKVRARGWRPGAALSRTGRHAL